MKAARPLLLLVALVAGSLLGTSCRAVNYVADDVNGILKAQVYHLEHIHRSLERHFLNYNWQDPRYDY